MTGYQKRTILNAYHGRAVALLGRVRDAVEAAGDYRVGDVQSLPNDEHEWSFSVFVAGDEDNPAESDIDVRLVLMDSDVQDYVPGGVNFGLEAIRRDGRLITAVLPAREEATGGWVPADDEAGVAARFGELSVVDPTAFAALVAAAAAAPE